ncbi:MAG TPA: hypothetical protein VFQ54_00965 [Thermomicrobiales bacterium]|nr:hypothetical protein [Thermomicrobiales bacterium]
MADHEGVTTPESMRSPSETGLPVPDVGAGSRDLATESTDPAELRHDLLLAKERLAFYESFDRVIGENIRRSGELMLERIAIREEAEARERANAVAEEARQVAAERERAGRTRLLADLVAEIDRIGESVDSLRTRLANELATTGIDSGPSTEPIDILPQVETAGETHAERAPEFVPDVPAVETLEPHLPPVAAELEATIEEPEPAGASAPPRTYDVLVHGVSRAAVAVSLQRYLNSLATISDVETREFAEGILRLAITSTREDGLSTEDVSGWSDGGTLSVRHAHPNAIELAIS